MFCYALNSILYYFDIEVIFLSTFSGLSILTWIFLYISSFVFKFCIYHRLPLYYILTIDIINYYDIDDDRRMRRNERMTSVRNRRGRM